MSERKPRGKSLTAMIGGIGGVGAVLLAGVAGYVGFDLNDSSGPAAADTVAEPGPEAGPEAVAESVPETCSMSDLPAEAEETAKDIQSGGPYDFPENDGTRFGNYEGVLPDEELGYYREYTVITPGLDHRGQRRIVTGGGQEHDPDVWFYTDDHYESFCEIPDAES